jgi:hypothetical protein
VIISLNIVKHLIFVMVKCGVIFEVRTKSLNIIQTSLSLKGLMWVRKLVYCVKEKKRNVPVSFQILMTVSMKMRVIWDTSIAPCRVVEVNRRFRGAYCLHYQGDRRDSGGCKHVWNASKLSRDYTLWYS